MAGFGFTGQASARWRWVIRPSPVSTYGPWGESIGCGGQPGWALARREEEQARCKLLARSSAMERQTAVRGQDGDLVSHFTPSLVEADGGPVWCGCARAANMVPCLHVGMWWFGLLRACVRSAMAQKWLGKHQYLLAIPPDLEISRGCWWEQERNHSPFPPLPQLSAAPCTSYVTRCNVVSEMDIGKIFRSIHSVLIHEGLTHRFSVFPPVFCLNTILLTLFRQRW